MSINETKQCSLKHGFPVAGGRRGPLRINSGCSCRDGCGGVSGGGGCGGGGGGGGSLLATAAATAPLADSAVDPGVEEDEEGEGDDAQDDEAAPVVVARVDVVHAHGRDGDERAGLKESDKDQGHAPTHSGAGAAGGSARDDK